MEITDAQIGEIAGTWSDYLGSWKTYAESDNTRYEIDDSDYQDAIDDGYEYGQDITDYDNTGWDKTKQVGRTVIDGTGALVSGGHALVSGGSAIVGKVAGKTAEKTTEKAVEKTAGSVVEKAIPGIGDWILIGACALDLTEAVIYKADKPNEDQVEAVNVLAEDMVNQQATTMDAQDALITMDSELIAASDEAVSVQENANTEIGDSRTIYQFHADTIKYYEKAKTAGYNFTQGDVELYQESLQYMTELSDDIGVTQEDAETAVNDIYDEMAGYQDGYDEAAEDIANVQGVTDYAAGFDELTQNNCSAESLIQNINQYASYTDTALAAANVIKYSATIGFAAAFAAAGLAAGAGGIMDGAAAKEQKEWSDDAGNEVALRQATQEMNEVSQQTYEENVDYYDGYMQNVEDLEIIVPDDMEVPETEIPSAGNQNSTGGRTSGGFGLGNGNAGNNGSTGNGGQPKKPKTETI